MSLLKNITKNIAFKNIFVGILFACFIYWIVSSKIHLNCSEIHFQIYSGGVLTLARITLIAIMLQILGFPFVLTAFICGLLTSPLTGSAIAGLSLVCANSIVFSIGRLSIFRNLSHSIEAKLMNHKWFETTMSSSSDNAINWYSYESFKAPIPLTWFAFISGFFVKKITLNSMLAATFISTIVLSISHSFAGSAIGCAIVDHTQGLPTKQYFVPAVISSLAVYFAEQIQTRTPK